jgi:aspartate racemase
MLTNKKILGVIGGMGPHATLTFFEKFIKYNKSAQIDQDHFPLYICNDPEIPDRTESIIMHNNLDVISKRLIYNAQQLEKIGCNSLIMPCNTAHHFYDQIQDNVEIPLISIVDETIREIKNKKYESFGLLSTLGTLFSCVYNKSAYDFNMEIKVPNVYQRHKLNKVIYDIKSYPQITPCLKKEKSNEIINICDQMNKQYHITNFILGCTELSIISENLESSKYKFIDPMEVSISQFYNSI